MKKLSYLELGATLFIPVLHKDLQSVTCGVKYPALRSLVIDCEDAISSDDYTLAMDTLSQFLFCKYNYKPYVFIRPRDVEGLTNLLNMEGIDKISGFILPKFSLNNAEAYLALLKNSHYYFMPSIEGKELFNVNELMELRDILLEYKEQIALIRFGLEDMLKQLGMRRKCSESIFDFAATNVVLGNLIVTFKSAGFALSGGVYPCYKDDDGFIKDVERDLKEGLFSKTIIHPNQIALSNELYKVTKEEYTQALEIAKSTKAIFAQNSMMAESKSMLPYSLEIVSRAEIYGLR